MDDAERKQTIADLMAYIGELQTSGVLEAVPSGRLARVAKLIGEVAEVIADDPSTYIPLFRDREIDPKTGKKPTALEWFEKVWKPRVTAGEATGDEIRQIDPAFYSNWASMLTKRGQKVSDVLPPSPTRSRIGPTEKDRTEHQRKRNRDRMRRYRAGVVDGERVEPGADVALFADREPDAITGNLPTAIEWFDIHWKPLVEQNGLTAADLKRFDPKLYSALAAAQTRAAASLGDLIPLRRKRLATMAPDELEARRDRIRSRDTEAKRRLRSKPTPS